MYQPTHISFFELAGVREGGDSGEDGGGKHEGADFFELMKVQLCFGTNIDIN